MGGGHPACKERGNSRYSLKTQMVKRKILPRNAKIYSKMIRRRTNAQQKQKRLKTIEGRRIERQLRNIEPVNSDIELIASLQGRVRQEITNQRIMYMDLKEEFTQDQMGFRQKMTSLKELTDLTLTSSLQDEVQHQMEIIKNLYQKLENLLPTAQSDDKEQLQDAITTINNIMRTLRSQNPSAHDIEFLQRISRELEKGSYEVKTLQGLYEELKNSFRTEQNGLKKLLQETVEMKKQMINVVQDRFCLQLAEVQTIYWDVYKIFLETNMLFEELRKEMESTTEQKNSLSDQLKSCQKKVAKTVDDHALTEKRIIALGNLAVKLQQAAVVPTKFNKMSSETQNMMAGIEQRSKEPKNYVGKWVWKIKNLLKKWEEAQQGGNIQPIYSPAFYASKYGYKMCLQMSFIKDGDMGEDSYMKLSLALMNRKDVGYQNFLAFRQKVTLRVHDLSGARYHLKKDFDPDQVPYLFEAISPDMLLLSNVYLNISCDTLERRTYTEYDTIFVSAIVNTTDLEMEEDYLELSEPQLSEPQDL